MKLIELFHKPTAGNAMVSTKGVIYDDGDFVVGPDGEPSQVMGKPDAAGKYKIKNKRTGNVAHVAGSDLKLATK